MNYHRPLTLQDALTLLQQPNTAPMGGGTWLNSPANPQPDADRIDLQALGINFLRKKGHTLEAGAALTLQQLLESPHLPPALAQALRLEAPLNRRNAATLAGTLLSADGRSPFAILCLALDVQLHFVTPEGAESSLGLAHLWALRPRGLVTMAAIPLNTVCAYQQVSRSPADLPIIAAALTRWSSGRARLALGGWGKVPALAMDGTEAEGLAEAARSACFAATDAWASAEYRQQAAATLAQRCLDETKK